MTRTDFQARVEHAKEAFVQDVMAAFGAAIEYVVQGAIAQAKAGLGPVARIPARPLAKAQAKAVIRRMPSGGFQMALPGGGFWHASRVRDLRRKARSKGIAFVEQGV